MTILPKGTILNGPDGQAYELVNDVESQSIARSADYKAIGGAPEARPNLQVPTWFWDGIQAEFAKKRAEASE